MQQQLVLLDIDRREWQLDERTREVGRTGVAAARRELAPTGRPGRPQRRQAGKPAAA